METDPDVGDEKYEAAVDRGLVEVVRERMEDGEDEWIPLEDAKRELALDRRPPNRLRRKPGDRG